MDSARGELKNEYNDRIVAVYRSGVIKESCTAAFAMQQSKSDEIGCTFAISFVDGNSHLSDIESNYKFGFQQTVIRMSWIFEHFE